MDFQIFGSDIKSGHDSLTRQLRDIILTRTKVTKNAVKKMMKILVTTPSYTTGIHNGAEVDPWQDVK